jgi:hypothetical protein
MDMEREKKNNEAPVKNMQEFNSLEYLSSFINTLPYLVVILDENRQILISNKKASDILSDGDLIRLLTKRPGEALKCIHSYECEDGCGSSDHCKYCGALNAIQESKKRKEPVTMECRIIASESSNLVFYNFEVTAAPFFFNGMDYTVFSMQDISAKKRKRQLERIFFHDILNTAANINGLSQLLSLERKSVDNLNLMKVIKRVSSELIEEIETQKQLTDAESGELELKIQSISSIKVLEELTDQFKNHLQNNASVLLDSRAEEISFESDPVLVTRVLKNMLKNAIEASGPAETITAGARKHENRIQFWVKNNAYIPESVGKQLFQKSYSTKGTGRGFGTYSMKLLGENYLKGKVHFTSSEVEGTTFFLDIPYKR